MYDLDSELPFPTYFHKYVTETFRTDAILNPEYHRQFRIVPAETFLQEFASDRRHMRKGKSMFMWTLFILLICKCFPEDGSWLKPPPSYPPISGPGAQSSHNLEDFIRMEAGASERGPVLSLTEFVRKFHFPSST